MPRARTPVAKAEVSGALAKNPQRRQGKANPKAAELGSAPSWFDPVQKRAWKSFKKELPWLAEADRMLVEMATALRAQFIVNPVDFGATKMNILRLCLAQLGATPADRSKITVPDADDEDPDDAFFTTKH